MVCLHLQTDVADEDFYDRVKKMHAQLEQTRREQEEAHDRLLQSHGAHGRLTAHHLHDASSKD
jgi:DNA replication initiation complex subunit (GINS family)